MSPGAAGTGHNRHLADPEPRKEAGDELRAQMIDALSGYLWGPREAADVLLAGLLAPLLAKLQAAEALAEEWERIAKRQLTASQEAGTNLGQRHDGWKRSVEYQDRADTLRRALGGERS